MAIEPRTSTTRIGRNEVIMSCPFLLLSAFVLQQGLKEEMYKLYTYYPLSQDSNQY